MAPRRPAPEPVLRIRRLPLRLTPAGHCIFARSGATKRDAHNTTADWRQRAQYLSSSARYFMVRAALSPGNSARFRAAGRTMPRVHVDSFGTCCTAVMAPRSVVAPDSHTHRKRRWRGGSSAPDAVFRRRPVSREPAPSVTDCTSAAASLRHPPGLSAWCRTTPAG